MACSVLLRGGGGGAAAAAGPPASSLLLLLLAEVEAVAVAVASSEEVRTFQSPASSPYFSVVSSASVCRAGRAARGS